MKFHDVETIFERVKKMNRLEGRYDYREFYSEYLSRVRSNSATMDQSSAGQVQGIIEKIWIDRNRPYFNIWPAIADAMLRTTLDVPETLIKLPFDAIAVRFPVGQELVLCDGFQATSIITCVTKFKGTSTLFFVAKSFDAHKSLVFMVPRLSPNETIEHSLKKSPHFSIGDPGTECLRLICCLCLMVDNPDLVQPDVLADDRPRYEETHDQKYVAKAIRRGKLGFNVGANITIDPHYRKAHLAIRHTGPGGSVPKVVQVKACIVKRNKLTEVPTGFLGPVTSV